MFAAFFYLLRQRGLNVSLNEWITLLEGMEKGLHHSTLTGFYHLCRAVVVKSETEFDRFDQVFLEFFKDVPYTGELPEELMNWLNHPSDDLRRTVEELRGAGFPEEDLETLLRRLEQKLKEQTEEHNGGSYWIGTNGYSNFGNSGHSPQGIRVGGKSMYRRAFQVAGERRFRDFRKDNVLDIRQFQMAFRLLRQYSEQTQEAKTEFDVDGTVRETCDNAGTLSVCYKRPRKNTVKVLMLMDSGGSMEYYSNLCSMLFQAARQSNHFKELHVYYFHNCIYSSVYTDPRMYREHAVPTDWILQNFGSEYKVILVGDALMDMYELMEKRYDYRTGEAKWSGLDQIKRFCEHYDHLIWLNPEEPPRWGGYWGESYGYIARAVDMYLLTVDGLERGMKKLLVNR